MDKKALITGVGQDASYLSEFLLEKGYQVYVLHRRYSSNNFDNFEGFKDKVNFICGDITDFASVHNIVMSITPDEIYNLAAMSHVGESFEQPITSFDVNAYGCLNFLECLRILQKTMPKYKPRFYQASTSELYGSNASYYGPFGRENVNVKTLNKDFDYELFQDEDTPFYPESPYAVAKLAAHHMCRLYRDSYGLHITAATLMNHEGPRRGLDFVTRKITKWAAEFKYFLVNANLAFGDLSYSEDEIITPLLSFSKLRLGNLDSYRDWSHAKDMVRGMWMMLQADVPKEYVLCSGKTHSIREFLDITFSYIGIPDWSNLVVQDHKFFRPSEVPHLCGRYDKINKELGWEPEIGFYELITEMVDADYEKAQKVSREYRPCV